MVDKSEKTYGRQKTTRVSVLNCQLLKITIIDHILCDNFTSVCDKLFIINILLTRLWDTRQ